MGKYLLRFSDYYADPGVLGLRGRGRTPCVWICGNKSLVYNEK